MLLLSLLLLLLTVRAKLLAETPPSAPAATKSATSSEAKNETAQAETLMGEIVDLHCHSSRGAAGAEHAGCAEACIRRGVPPALLTTDGKLFMLLDEKMTSVSAKVAGKVGKAVKVTGVIVEDHGVKIMKATSIE
jgi:hypothetical protein